MSEIVISQVGQVTQVEVNQKRITITNLNLHPTPQASSDNQSPMDVPRLSVYLRRHGQVSKAVKAITPEEENRNREERLKKRREQKKRENDKR